jgi:fatty-acyl-CoA synthase
MQVMAGYGMSETCPVLSLAQPQPDMDDWDSAALRGVVTRTGMPAPLVRIETVTPEGKPLPPGKENTGEVVAQAPWLTQGYFKDSTNSEQLWRDGYLHTGDIGYIDPQGYLQITDRIKDVIKTGGEWISSLEIEDIISQHPAVSEAAVIGVPDEKWGERALALVVLKPGQSESVTPDEIKAHIAGFSDKGVISNWAVPDRVEIVDAIEKTSVGKIDKKLLRTKYH